MMRDNFALYVLLIVAISTAYCFGQPCVVSYPLPHDCQNAMSLAFSPDGKYLAVANLGKNGIALYQVHNGALDHGTPYALPTHYDAPFGLAFSPDGKYLVTATETTNSITIFKFDHGIISSGKDYHLPSGAHFPTSVAFSPDGKFIAIANALANPDFIPGIITIISFNDGVITDMANYSLPPGSQDPWDAVFSPNGFVLATANTISDSGAGDVTLFQVKNGILSNGTSFALPEGSSGIESIAFSPDGNYIATINTQSSDITFMTLNNQTSSFPLPSNAKLPRSGTFSPNEKYFVTVNEVSSTNPGNVALFQVNNRTLSKGAAHSLPPGSSEPVAVEFSPDGKYFATANYNSTDVTVFKLSCYLKASI